jgi:hypothetical protein
MEVKYSFVCDYSTKDAAGKLIVMGIFDNINAHAYPYTHPSFFYVAGLKFRPSEAGRHTFAVKLIDYDGRALIQPLEGAIDVAEGQQGVVNLMLNLGGVVFPRPSQYTIDLLVDAQSRASETINLARA